MIPSIGDGLAPVITVYQRGLVIDSQLSVAALVAPFSISKGIGD